MKADVTENGQSCKIISIYPQWRISVVK